MSIDSETQTIIINPHYNVSVNVISSSQNEMIPPINFQTATTTLSSGYQTER